MVVAEMWSCPALRTVKQVIAGGHPEFCPALFLTAAGTTRGFFFHDAVE